MKTLIVSILLAVTSFTNYAVANQSFAYNSEMNGDQVKSENIYKVESGKYLLKHLKYNFTYDAQGRISQKEVLKWNADSQNFEKQYVLNFTYSEREVTIEYLGWNAKSQDYSKAKEKAVYQISEENNVLNYLSYEWSTKENDWSLIVQHTTTSWNHELLAFNQ